MATARKTTRKVAAKKAAKKAATLEEIQKLIGQVVEADTESGEYEFENLTLKVTEGWLTLDNDGDDIDDFRSLDEVRTKLEQMLEESVVLKVTDVEDSGFSDDATVDSDGITVGCKTVPFNKFDEIAAMVAKYRAKN